jgi:hypothetical protein
MPCKRKKLSDYQDNFAAWSKDFNARFAEVVERERQAGKISQANEVRIKEVRTRGGSMSPTLLYSLGIVAGDLRVDLNWLFGIKKD